MKRIFFLVVVTFFFSCTKNEEKCINPAKIDLEAMCTKQYNPVCGCNGKTYGNLCEAQKAGITSWTKGECKEGAEVES